MIHITPNGYTDGCVGIQYNINNPESKQHAIDKMMLLVSLFEDMNAKGEKVFIEYKD